MNITREGVLESAAGLPGFPVVVTRIIAAIDDPESALDALVDLIERDPVVAARVLALANTAASRTRHITSVKDLFTAVSLLGLNRVRQIAMIGACLSLFERMNDRGDTATFSQHAVAVAICAEELAFFCDRRKHASSALIAGLLHDIGQLWLQRFHHSGYDALRTGAVVRGETIKEAEQKCWGVTHAEIGAWLAEHWGLPTAVVNAIASHHCICQPFGNDIAPLIHVAETLANALDLGERKENRVVQISGDACEFLGIQFNTASRTLFGRIEARNRHAQALIN